MIDPVKELNKLQKKQEALEQSVTKLEQLISSEDYEIRVPEEVRTNNLQKLEQSRGQLEHIVDAMAALKTME